jgi:hypothetical protein
MSRFFRKNGCFIKDLKQFYKVLFGLPRRLKKALLFKNRAEIVESI